ncbi:hypothetical protein M3A49_05590 [Paraburkholderia sp. CNPSo 3076]|nr:hypothetical protein [Paraburkholderia sp. CNPSo 3076]
MGLRVFVRLRGLLHRVDFGAQGVDQRVGFVELRAQGVERGGIGVRALLGDFAAARVQRDPRVARR